MCRISNIDEDWAVARQFCCFAFEVADDHEDIFHQFPPSFFRGIFFQKRKFFGRKKIKIFSKSQYIIIFSGNCGGRDRENPKNYQKICNKDIRGNTAFLIRYLN